MFLLRLHWEISLIIFVRGYVALRSVLYLSVAQIFDQKCKA